MRILFIAQSLIGDVVMSCGVLDHLLRVHPEARVTVAVSRHAMGLFEHMPRLERIIVVEKRPWHAHWLGLWAETATTTWDLVVDMKGSGLSLLLRTRRRAIRRPGRGRMVEQHAALLGIEPVPLPVAWTSPADRSLAAELIPADRPVIGLCPTAGWEPKMWPSDRFAALFGLLADTDLPGARPVIFAGPGATEHALAAPLVAALPDAIDLCGMLTLSQAVACLERCRLFVGNDSGLMHLAAASGVATVGIRGMDLPTAPMFEPAGRAAAWVLGKGGGMSDIEVEAAADVSRSMMALVSQGALLNPSDGPDGLQPMSRLRTASIATSKDARM